MTEQEIQFMIEDLKQRESIDSGSSAWMWFGLTEKLMMSDATKRKQIENLTFIECSELLLLWDKREQELNKDRKKQIEQSNKKKLSQL
jgi:hypothetical protein